MLNSQSSYHTGYGSGGDGGGRFILETVAITCEQKLSVYH